MKKYYFYAIIIFIVSCKTVEPSSSMSLQQIENIKDYFFCRCIEHSYNIELAQKIKQHDISQSVLFDVGNLGKYYKLLDSLAMEKAKTIVSTQISDYQNKKPVIMMCLKYSREINFPLEVRNNKE